jgi:beta-fructofuranosidase
MLRLPDDWIWDSWIADDGERYHLFFLKAPRSLLDAGQRHTAATIGHAISTDLTTWEYVGDALRPSAGGWDDLALWTGSVVRADDGVWRMFYTAISTRGHGIRDQRVGMAESADLMTWRRSGDGPVLEIDPRWYRCLATDPRASETWRDPFVFRDPGGDGWHMLITARDLTAPRLSEGVLAHARSHDLRTWELGPPIARPGGFGELEVPHVHCIHGQPVLTFTCHPVEQSEETRRRFGEFCTWYVLGDSLTGPWDLTQALPFEDEPKLFAAPLVEDRDGRWVFLGFLNQEREGIHSFEIVDPIPVELRDGRLQRADG